MEAMVLGRAGSLTPAGLRAAIRRAVMDVNPGHAKKRREHAAKKTRVERWAEDSGNAGLAGRELPPAEVLAADQRVTAWAQELRKAGLDGSWTSSGPKPSWTSCSAPTPGPRPAARTAPALRAATAARAANTVRPPRTAGRAGGRGDPARFAARVNMTIPAVTILDLADRAGELAGIGPIDPDLARDLAEAAARNPRSTWCVTVTDSQGHAIGHGCARPAPASTPSDIRTSGPTRRGTTVR